MLPVVLAEVELIERLALDARGSVCVGLIGLAAECWQFAGLMGSNSGDHVAALAVYRTAEDPVCRSGSGSCGGCARSGDAGWRRQSNSPSLMPRTKAFHSAGV